MPVYKADAIVLRRRPLGEADRVLTLYTKEWGKLSAVARGVRRTASRQAGRLEPFSHVDLLLAQGRGSLDGVAQVEVRDGMAALRNDLRRFGAAALAAELLEAATPERESHPELFHLTAMSLGLIARDVASAPAWFALRLVSLVGFQPALEACAVCGRRPDPAPSWSHPLGGAVCSRCAVRDPAAARLRPDTLRALRTLMAAKTDGWPLPEVRDPDRLLDVLRRYAEHRLEVRLRSPAVIEQFG